MSSTPAMVISGYTEEGSGTGPGLVRFAVNGRGLIGESQARATDLRNPSFVAAAGEVLLAVEELAVGNVVALDLSTLQVLARTPSGGADPCHVALVGDTVWAAHYTSGTAAALDFSALLAKKAPLTPKLLAHAGISADGGHAHQVTATPWGTVLVADLGADSVDEYDAGSYARLGSAQLPQGAGPRHVALKGQFLLVAGELDGQVHVFAREPQDQAQNSWQWLFKVPLAENAEEISSARQFHPSHIELSADESKLYAAVRGPNTLVVLDVTGLSSDPSSQLRPREPKFLQQVSCGGNWPRHFTLAHHKMYVANQLSNNVAVFDFDDRGLLHDKPVQSVDFGSPTCIVPLN